MLEAEALCREAGALLQRASVLGAVQMDAASDLVARVASLVERVGDDELRGQFLPPLVAIFGGLASAGVPVGSAVVGFLNDAAAKGADELRSAIASVFRSLAGLESIGGN